MFKIKENTSPLYAFAINAAFLRLGLSLVPLVVLAILSSIFTNETASTVIFYLCSVLGLLFGLYQFYQMGLGTGQRDYNLIKYDRIKPDRYKAVKAGVIAEIIPFVLLVMMVVTEERYESVYAVVGYIYIFVNFCFVFLRNIVDSLHVFWPTLVLFPLVCAIGYHHGLTQYDLLSRIVYQNPNKTKDKDKRIR